MKLYTTDPGKNKKVLCGEVIGTALFRWVKPEHFMRVNQSYGIQEVAFQEICLKGILLIVLKEEGTTKRWEATVETWNNFGKVLDYGHGKQRFLSMKYQKDHKDPIKAREEKENERDQVKFEKKLQRFEQTKLFDE